MPVDESVWRSAEDVQALDNALSDAPIPSLARRALLKRAGLGVLAASAGGTLLAACGGSSNGRSGATATMSATSTTGAGAQSGGDTPAAIINTAITAEALAVTYLSAVIQKAPGTPVAKFADVLKAANAAEYDHYKALKSLGAKPLTTKFWVPDDFFGHELSGVFPTLQVAEALFVDAYLIGATTFANAGKANLARYTIEIATVEAQHLVLANYGAGVNPPNDLGFMQYPISEIGQVVTSLQNVGVGFGRQGSKPGAFATFAPPPSGTTVHIPHDSPA